jgi:putative tricarboxylic transport membrane protein
MRSFSPPVSGTHSRLRAIRAGGALLTASGLALALAACTQTAAEPAGDATTGPAESINIIIPADPGGGFDQLGRTIDSTLASEGLAASTEVSNIGGAGGTVGLAALANETDPYTLFVTGLVTVGAVETNSSPTRLEDTTPIARLTEEALVVVVPASSPYKTLEDLVDDILKNGKSVTVTGGSAGGADNILAALVLKDAGASAAEVNEKLNYVANAGGGEAVTLLLGNTVSAGISGVGEFVEHINSGALRALAVSSAEPVALLPDTPTIIESGYDVELTNWRAVVAPKDIDADVKAALEKVIADMHDSAAWKEELTTRGWTDAYLPSAEFSAFLKDNISEIKVTLKDIGLVQ